MATPIFRAIGRGYSARTILKNIGERYPHYAANINNLYYSGYAANSILASLASHKEGKNYDPDMFLTEHEKTFRRDQQEKTKDYMRAIAMAGTAGAIAAGAYEVYRRNKPLQGELIIPPSYGKKAGKKGSQYTIEQENLRLPNYQKQIPYKQGKITNKGQVPAIGPIAPKPAPQQPRQGPVAPTQGPLKPTQPISPTLRQNQGMQQQQAPQQPASYNPKMVDLVKNLKEEQRFKNIIDAGYEPLVTTQILRGLIPKEILPVIEKAPGGLEQVVKDYTGYYKDEQRKQRELQEQEQKLEKQPEIEIPEPEEPAEQVGQVQLPTAETQRPPESKQQIQEERQPEPQMPAQQPIVPRTPINPIEQKQIEKPSEPAKEIKPQVSLKNGKIGDLESIKNGVATINVDGKIHKEKASNIEEGPPDLEKAVRDVLGSIPENLKSTNLQSIVHIPGLNVMLTQFYDGKWAWYLDVPENIYKNISLGIYQPKGEAITGIAEYKPSSSDSRGAGFDQEIKKNPKYAKHNKGITWGYADNEYSILHKIQPMLHKISKERYDKEGNLISPVAKDIEAAVRHRTPKQEENKKEKVNSKVGKKETKKQDEIRTIEDARKDIDFVDKKIDGEKYAIQYGKDYMKNNIVSNEKKEKMLSDIGILEERIKNLELTKEKFHKEIDFFLRNEKIQSSLKEIKKLEDEKNKYLIALSSSKKEGRRDNIEFYGDKISTIDKKIARLLEETKK